MAKSTKAPVAVRASAAKAVAAKPAKAAKAKPAKLTDEQADVITQSKAVASGRSGIVVDAAGGQSIVIDKDRLTKQLNQLAVVGGSFKAVQAYITAHSSKIAPALAKGIESRANPHSSKAVADDRARNKPAPATKAPVATGSKAPAKAKLPAKSEIHAATLTVLVKAKDSGLKDGSDRYMRLQAIEGCKTVADALAKTIAGGKRIAMDNLRGMEKRGHVKIG